MVGVHKWIFPANWKYAAENFLGDTYHNPSHRSVDLIGIGPSAEQGVKGRRDNELEFSKHVWVSFPHGHGVHSAVMPEGREYVEQFKNDPEIEEYFRSCFEKRKAAKGMITVCGLLWAPFSRIPLFMAPSRAASASGILIVQLKRKAGVFWLTQMRPKSERFPSSLLHALFRPGRYDRAG